MFRVFAHALRRLKRRQASGDCTGVVVWPTVPGPRPPCPLYGFFRLGSQIFSHERRCGLEPDCACAMEVMDKDPDMYTCPLLQGKDLLSAFGRFRIYPDDYQPIAGTSARPGLLFDRWHDLVMSRDCPRPPAKEPFLEVIKVTKSA